MRNIRKNILLTKTEFNLWTKKACSEGMTLNEFIRQCVRSVLKAYPQINPFIPSHTDTQHTHLTHI